MPTPSTMSPAASTYFMWLAICRVFSFPYLPFIQSMKRLKASFWNFVLPTCRSEVSTAYTGCLALCGIFWPTSGNMMSSARNSALLVFTTARQTTWSWRRLCAFFLRASFALCVMSTVALASRSSTTSMVFCFASLFSLIMQTILSLALGWDFRASVMGVAALTSILCLSRRSRRLNLSWK